MPSISVPIDARQLRELRLLVVVAHPDDEVLGCGILLARAGLARIIHVTDGAPRNGEDAARQGFASSATYASARHAEATAALALAGRSPTDLEGFGIPDQQVSQHLAALARRLRPAIRFCDLVVTHAYEGGHSDHDAVAFATHAAHRMCSDPPLLIEMPFYHAGAEGWIRQAWVSGQAGAPECTIALDVEERALKHRMITAHATQRETLAGFSLDTERFRVAPRHDFGQLPHAGPMLYERHGWGLTADDWLARVRAAQAELGLDPA